MSATVWLLGPTYIGSRETWTTPRRTACWSPGAAWDLVGGFDERYFPAYFEDVDLCLAMAEHGLRVRYEPQALVVHQGSQSTSVGFREFLLWRNQRKLVEKWGRALERFEPPPGKDSGPAFDAAVKRAIKRTRARGNSSGTDAAESRVLRRPPIPHRPPQT